MEFRAAGHRSIGGKRLFKDLVRNMDIREDPLPAVGERNRFSSLVFPVEEEGKTDTGAPIQAFARISVFRGQEYLSAGESSVPGGPIHADERRESDLVRDERKIQKDLPGTVKNRPHSRIKGRIMLVGRVQGHDAVPAEPVFQGRLVI